MDGRRLILCAVLAIFATSSPAQEAPPRLNVLWILGEDLGPELACYADSGIKTPHLDGLARDGVLFRRAFAPAPVCSPSRSGFMTGMNPITIGAHHHRSRRGGDAPLPDGVKLLTDWVRPAGYFTANLRDLTGDAKEKFVRGTGKTDWNFTYEGKPFDGQRWSQLKEPFFAQINFSETHRGRDWDQAHEHVEPIDPSTVRVPPYYPNDPAIRADWAQYLNAVMALDQKVGAVLAQLDRDGLSERTVVIFMGDHGRAMVRGKQWPLDCGLHVPLLIRWPKAARPKGVVPGTADHRLVSLLDVAATTLDLCGVPKPEKMEGRVLFGERAEPPRDYVFATRDRCDETMFRIRSVRDRRYRYVRNFMPELPFFQLNRYKDVTYPAIAVMRRLYREGKLDDLQASLFLPHREPEELYDVVVDPYETVNLVGAPGHQEALVRLRGVLRAWIADGRDPAPEDTAELEAAERQLVKGYEPARAKRDAKARAFDTRDEAEVPFYVLPDPLRANDGRRIDSAKDWVERRRPELVTLFENHVYGRVPNRAPVGLRTVVREVDREALSGTAVRKQVDLVLGPGLPTLRLLVYLPISNEPVPVFLGLNFKGNQTIASDEGILPSGGVVLGHGDQVASEHLVGDFARGFRASRWPVERILQSGFGIATMSYTDIDPDVDDGFKNGVHPFFLDGKERSLGDGGSIAAWAWGLSRAMDYLVADSDVDQMRVTVFGHSRLGKTALWAGALDQRFAAVISNDSGCGGAALSKRRFGETVAKITSRFPHWFGRRFTHYSDREEALPVDQHELLALIAPRPLLVSSAAEDSWADPEGERLATEAARPVYVLLDPSENGVRPRSVRRAGGHDVTSEDWTAFLEFAPRGR